MTQLEEKSYPLRKSGFDKFFKWHTDSTGQDQESTNETNVARNDMKRNHLSNVCKNNFLGP